MESRQEPPPPAEIVSPWDAFLATSTSPGQGNSGETGLGLKMEGMYSDRHRVLLVGWLGQPKSNNYSQAFLQTHIFIMNLDEDSRKPCWTCFLRPMMLTPR